MSAQRIPLTDPTQNDLESVAYRSAQSWCHLLRRSCLILIGLVVGQGVGVGIPEASAQAVARFAVLRQPQLGQNWSQIQQQLDRANVSYQILEQGDLTLDQLTQFQTLFLPNLSHLEPSQTETLRTWIEEQDGRLIASGPLMLDETAKSEMRTLLGAYWSNDLPYQTSIELTPYSHTLWQDTIMDSAPIRGGALIPSTTSGIRLVANWSGVSGDPFAVVATSSSVYLGWEWGSLPSDEAVSRQDQQWLRAALIYLQQGLEEERRALNPDDPDALDDLGDPDAPNPLPDILPEVLPINTFEMLAMRAELQSLVGRIESALLVTQATQTQTDLSSNFEMILNHAQSVVKDLPEWVEAGEFLKARREFEQARADLWSNYPVDRLTALPEVRAIWLDRGTIVEAGSERGLAEVFDRLANAGINTVFFETINAGYPIYPSRIAPAQNPLTRSWDPLAAAVKLAHERNIELHAWMWTFAVGNTRHNVLPEIGRPQTYPGPVLTAHPDWANYDDRGELIPRGQPETWLDPANPEVRRYLLALIEEMVDYGVDGIQLDYIRYPFQNAASRATFGYGDAARRAFEQLTGFDPTLLDPVRDRSLWQVWTEFRAEQVNSFVAEVSNTLQRRDPRVILSAAVYALPEVERIHKLQQDWERWIEVGHIDLLVPMTYTENTRRLAQLVEPNLEIVRKSPVLFIPSVNLLDLPAVEFLDQMQVVRDLPTGGYALFATRQLNEQLQEILSQSAIASTQIPYRNPFSTAQDRFKVLQQEWEFLIAGNDLRVLEPGRADWLAQIERVDRSLTQLAQNPTEANLIDALADLETLRYEFPEWMRMDALQNAYRVNTWENRLASLEMLLRYGQRILPRLTASETNADSPSL